VVDGLIHGIGIDLAGAVSLPYVAEQSGELRVVAGADPFVRGAPFGFRAYDATLPCCSQTGRGPARLTSRADAGRRSAVPGPLTSATIEPGTPARSALRPAYPR
jgi:hypothetical protein